MVLSLIPSSIYVYHLCFESVATATFFLFFFLSSFFQGLPGEHFDTLEIANVLRRKE